ncbi:MAG: uroporphyrin-III C-methyltransferase [Acidimicrobiia bacterium]|nr:MAG: uroporphyrin-III C-methyltransferase [Acidimicrobiia bacterium]
MKHGKVYLVGAGPGDPDLLTLKAVRVLGRADVVLHDRLVEPGVLEFANPEAEVVPVGKRPGDPPSRQRRILELMRTHAEAGRVVVRLKGGDPMVFGRGGEEWSQLAEWGIEVEVVPGVSSAVAVPAIAGIPLTHRGVAGGFAVAAGRSAGGATPDWSRYVGVDTLVVLMGVGDRRRIAAGLIEAGRSPQEPVAFVMRGTTPAEKVVEATLEEVAAGEVEVEAPAVMVVGEVVRLRAGLTSGAVLAKVPAHSTTRSSRAVEGQALRSRGNRHDVHGANA